MSMKAPMAVTTRDSHTSPVVEIPDRTDHATGKRPKLDLIVRVFAVSYIAYFVGLYSRFAVENLAIAGFERVVHPAIFVLVAAGLSRALASPIRWKGTFALSILTVVIAVAAGVTPG